MVLRLGLLLLVALVLAGCGGDDHEPAATAAATTATTTTATKASCVPATSDLMTPVGGRVALAHPGMRVQNGQLVQSEATPGVWFLSVELDGPGFEETGDIATWATTSRFGGEAIYAVDELAEQHTDFRPVAQAEGISADDPAAEASRACTE